MKEYHSRGLLPWWSVEQYHVVSVQGRRGVFGGHDHSLHSVGSRDDTIVGVVPCAISCAYHSISGTVLAGIYANYDERKDIKCKYKP